jgi:[ribosomal protein S5]-alanine N-acetyltransferase
MLLQTDRIYLEILSEENVSPDYHQWMNDYEITRFLESRWKYQTRDSVLDYIRYINKSENDVLFGMFLLNDKKHIGNIKIGSINWVHRNADVGLLIGDRNAWGKGYGTDAIRLVTKYAFESLNLHKLIAGIYRGNEGSYKAFIKAGWSDIGIMKEHRFFEGKYVDEYLVEIISSAK